MAFTVIIPARYASSRLPGKPLLDLAGKTMLEHVWHQACASEAQRVVIATDDARVQEVAQGFGAQVIMTRAEHPSGTDRLQEAAALLGLPSHEVVVNVQGDEPLIPPELINQVAANLAQHPQASMATLSEPITQMRDLLNPNLVKLVADQQQYALYFSRSPLPWARDHFTAPLALSDQPLPESCLGQFQRHVGLYAYRVALLNAYVTWPIAPLEAIEQLEQLRILWQGHKIHVASACTQHPAGIDTQEDYQRVVAYLLERQASAQSCSSQS